MACEMPTEQVQLRHRKAAPRCVNTRGHGTKGLASMPFDPTQVDPKPCKRCGTPFMPAAYTRKPSQWANQRYCSRRCAALERNLDQPKRGTLEEREARRAARGDRAGRERRPVGERLMEKVAVAESGCWEWTGCIGDDGYGHVMDDVGRTRPAHRVSYELHVGPVPADLHMDHLCRNRSCVNPAHLEPVTRTENARRGLYGVLKTHCAQGHLWIAENIEVTGGRRRCKVCRRERDAVPRKDRAGKARQFWRGTEGVGLSAESAQERT